MSEDQILQLAKAALEVNELEEAIDQPVAQPARATRALGRRLLPVGMLAAAALVTLLALPPGLRILDCVIIDRTDRSHQVEDHWHLLTLRVSRPGFVRIVVVDERLERWVLPFQDHPDGSPMPVTGEWSGRLPLSVSEDDSRGPARVAYYIVIASKGLSPTLDELLRAIPEPIAKGAVNDKIVFERLEHIAAAIESQFDSAAHVGRVP